MTDDTICRGDARHTAADRRVPGTGGGETSGMLALAGKVALLLNYRAFGLDTLDGIATDGMATFRFSP